MRGKLCIGVLCSAVASFAAAEGVETLERVEVTGSRLKRTDTETPSPVQVIGHEEIARSGASSLAEVMQRLPASNAGTFNQNDTIGTRGASSVSLHGLGPGSTLVLVNGRRVAPFGFAVAGTATFVDLNQIPIGAIDRIEVLLDGASAIYGSDALAGVVNIILRRDFRGAEAGIGLGRSTHGDGTARAASLAYGTGTLGADGYNIFATFSHDDQDAIPASARWHSRTSDYRPFGAGDLRSPFAYPGNLYTIDNRRFLQPLVPCATIGGADSPLPGGCLYDPASFKDLTAGTRRDSLFVAGTARLSAGFELFGDATIARTWSRLRHVSGPTSIYADTLGAPFITLPVGHPQNPYPNEVALRTRFADEPRSITAASDTQRVVVGARHADLAGWDVESGILWSASRTRAVTLGVIDQKVLVDEVLDPAGRARPSFRFGDPDANDPGLMARLYPRLVDTGRTSTASIDLRGTHPVFRLPGGDAQVVLGGELRRERLDSSLDPLIAAGNVTHVSAFVGSGHRTIASAFAELALPLARSLEATVAGRLDRYSDFGSTFNPKAGLKWKVLPQTALRATYASGYRAPSLIETHQEPRKSFAAIRDPRACPIPDDANPACAEGVQIVEGGNPDLRPERSRSATVGIVVEPWRNASMTIDAFRITRRDQIASIDADYLLAHEADFPGYVVRAADGTIQQLNLPSTNLGAQRLWGIDAAARARTTVAALGTLDLEGSYEWLPHFRAAPAHDSPLLDYAGTYLQPKARGRLAVGLDRGHWKSSIAVNYTGGYLRAFSPADLSCPYDQPGVGHPELCRVKSWRTVDLFVGYSGFHGLDIGLSVTNLDNVQAPFDEQMLSGNFTTYQSALHSAVGRFFRLTAKYTFR